MKISSLVVDTPHGHSGRLFVGAGGDYLFRCSGEAEPECAISLLMPI